MSFRFMIASFIQKTETNNTINVNYFLSHLVLLLGDHVQNGVDDDTGPVDDVGHDVDGLVVVALVKLVVIIRD